MNQGKFCLNISEELKREKLKGVFLFETRKTKTPKFTVKFDLQCKSWWKGSDSRQFDRLNLLWLQFDLILRQIRFQGVLVFVISKLTKTGLRSKFLEGLSFCNTCLRNQDSTMCTVVSQQSKNEDFQEQSYGKLIKLLNSTYCKPQPTDKSLVMSDMFSFIIWLGFSINHSTGGTGHMSKILLT